MLLVNLFLHVVKRTSLVVHPLTNNIIIVFNGSINSMIYTCLGSSYYYIQMFLLLAAVHPVVVAVAAAVCRTRSRAGIYTFFAFTANRWWTR